MKKRTVIEYFGSVTKTARALGITPQAVSRWKETIPYVSALDAERVTGRALVVNHKMYERRRPVGAARP
jgi:hypothetical protein